MLTDKDFDIVFFSEYLKNPTSSKDPGYRKIFQDLESVLNRHGYKAHLLPYKKPLVPDGQLSIWCRDYMPVHTVGKNLLRFSYTPDYLKFKKYEGHEPDNRWVCESMGMSCINMSGDHDGADEYPKIVLDGGNIVRCGKKVIMVDKVFRENPHLPKEEIIRDLENKFDAHIIWLPHDKREYLGHSDGIVRYISGNKVVMAPYGDPCKNKKDKEYDRDYRDILVKEGMEVLPLDFSGIDEPSDKRWAYTNWLQLKDLIILPAFKDCPKSNERAFEQIKEYTKMLHCAVEMVEADALVKGGGAFNCASWTTTRDVIDSVHL